MGDKTRKRILELEDQIDELQRERNRLRCVVKHIFDEEREYLYERDETTYEQYKDRRKNDGSLGKRVMSKRFKPIWTGIITVAMFDAFGYKKQMKYLTEEEIKILKPIIRKEIDKVLRYKNELGLELW